MSASVSTASLPQLPYHVQRTASQELPVYHLARRGGNLHQTRIRKIRGDVTALRDDLRAFLRLKNEHAAINQITGHIILKVRGYPATDAVSVSQHEADESYCFTTGLVQG